MNEIPAEVRDAVLAEADQHFLADPDAPVEPRPVATGYLTRETLEAAFARLEHHELRADPVRAHAERVLARWLDEQPPGASERLLRQMYCGTEQQ